jgi:pimeloyl-ACP methyl ester carboxylesterase
MPELMHDGILFTYQDTQTGHIPFVFQHGLGGDATQAFQVFSPPPQIRLICLECRAHGTTHAFGGPEKLNFPTFADDVIALVNTLQIPKAIFGGISMGAGVSLNLALKYPERVQALVLSRPAWLNAPMPLQELFRFMGDLIHQHGPLQAQAVFRESALYQDLVQQSPAVAESALTQFTKPGIEETYPRFWYIPQSVPFSDMAQLTQIHVPTLILATQDDPVHPFSFGKALAKAIPHAEFVEIISKSRNPTLHEAQTQQAITEFLWKSPWR